MFLSSNRGFGIGVWILQEQEDDDGYFDKAIHQSIEGRERFDII
jgi:hypothetical protein